MLAWEFVVRDEAGRARALIDRNWQSFGRELFTDAGRYAIHYGDASREAAVESASRVIAAAHPNLPPARTRALVPADAPPDAALVPTSTGAVLALDAPLTELDGRLAVLAAAIAVDFDFFSRHSSATGGVAPFFMPLPVPPVPVPEVGGAGGGGVGGGEGGGGAGPIPDAAPPPPPAAR